VRNTRIVRRSILCAVFVVVFADIAGGCGGSDADSSTTGAPKRSSASTVGSEVNAAERQEIARVLPTLREKLRSRDPRGFCALLTSDGKRDVIKSLRVSLPIRGTDCPNAVRGYLATTPRAVQRPVVTKNVVVEGSASKVTIRGGFAGPHTVTYALRREDGKWKVVNPLTAVMP
jgi:hypothetical protein